MTKYQKLTDIGAIWSNDQSKAKLIDFYRLEMPDSKRTDREVAILVDAAFRTSIDKGIELPMPDKVAEALGKSCITVDQYLSNLRKSGFDVVGLLAFADEIQNCIDESKANRQSKAAAFFNLIQTQWIIDDDDVKKYIDSESVYDLLELVLDHADSIRGRLNAFRKREMDPKQADKVLVRECWEDWQKMPDRYDSKAAFARDMLSKFERLESQAVIERWCRDWGREA